MEEFGLSDLLLVISAFLIILKMLDVSGFNSREHPKNDLTTMKNVTPVAEETSATTESPFIKLVDSLKSFIPKTTTPYEASLPHKVQLALDSIKKLDRQFTTKKFLELTIKLHVKVIQALNSGNLTTLDSLCSKATAQKLAQELQSKQEGNIQLRSVYNYEAVTITKAYADSKQAHIVMKIVTLQVYYEKANPADEKKVLITDNWTLSRSINSTEAEAWKLDDFTSKEADL